MLGVSIISTLASKLRFNKLCHPVHKISSHSESRHSNHILTFTYFRRQILGVVDWGSIICAVPLLGSRGLTFWESWNFGIQALQSIVAVFLTLPLVSESYVCLGQIGSSPGNNHDKLEQVVRARRIILYSALR